MPMVPVEELIGKTVGSARPVRLLGHGKLSAVYEAYQPEQNRSVMLTLFLVPPSFPPTAHEHFLQRFKQEATALVRLNHPSILPTYDFGDYGGYPYLLTPFVNKIPLGRFLKQRDHFSLQETLFLLQQIASCIDYAHSQQIIHGTLSASNILIDQDLSIQVAGFGFMRMLEARGILSLQQPYAHLLSIAGTFLGSPEYLAPEYVQGEPADGTADVYAIGILLYELLSGTRPFEGSNPYEIALQHVQKRVPSLHEQFSFVPAALDVVIAQALEQNPAQRFQTAGALVSVFGRVLKILDATVSVPQNALPTTSHFTSLSPSPTADPKLTMPPTVNWFDEGMLQANGLQATSFTKTGPMAAINNTPSPTNQNPGFYNDATTQIPGQPVDQAAAIDPFAWWSAASQPVEERGQLLGEKPLTATKHSKIARQQGIHSGKRGGQTVPQEGRRRTVAVLAGGGVVALGVLGFGGISLAHLLTKKTASTSGGSTQTTLVSTPVQTKATTSTSATPTHAPTPTSAPKPTATPAQAANTPPTAAPIQQPTAAPTLPAPTPTTAPPAHTGTVIGASSQAKNTGLTFTNPADQQSSLLIHLPNGNFTAFELACSHEGAATRYDAAAQVIRCTRHTNGTYNPTTGTPTGGPPPRPLQQVQIRVNGDGTITTG